jgi:hypothetical protein
MMDGDAIAQMGAKDAERLTAAIQSSLDLVTQMKGAKTLWWGGFIAALAGFCYADIGAEAHDVIMACTQEALSRSTKPTGRRTQ